MTTAMLHLNACFTDCASQCDSVLLILLCVSKNSLLCTADMRLWVYSNVRALGVKFDMRACSSFVH